MSEKKFWGTFEVSMDEMVRVRLPAELRKQFNAVAEGPAHVFFVKPEGLAILVGFDGNEDHPSFPDSFYTVSEDKGRLPPIKPYFRDLLGLKRGQKRRMIIVGMGNHFHLMPKSLWGKLKPQYDQQKQDFLDKKGLFIPTIETPPNL